MNLRIHCEIILHINLNFDRFKRKLMNHKGQHDINIRRLGAWCDHDKHD